MSASSHHSRSSTVSSSSFLTFPVTYAVSGLLRRLSSEPSSISKSSASSSPAVTPQPSLECVYTPPRRQASPFQPPPLFPLSLKGYKDTTRINGRLLSRALAEEIRLLVPPRLQLVADWQLVYSLEQNGVSLNTLYQRCEEYRDQRGGFVLVVRDGGGSVFGAYLSDAPAPNPHFYGTGECFLWRATKLPTLPSLLSLPPPPSEDTTNLHRMTTLGIPKDSLTPPTSDGSRSGASTPERIRFKAFPYSGVNDYMIFCQQNFLSVGGGDGHYGLWLNDNFEKGVSDSCPTFGNEPLSDEGTSFDVLGVELWFIGSVLDHI